MVMTEKHPWVWMMTKLLLKIDQTRKYSHCHDSAGYIKRMTMDNFRSQNRGGRGIKGMTKLDEDCITELMMANTHDYILFFTNKGRVFQTEKAMRFRRHPVLPEVQH